MRQQVRHNLQLNIEKSEFCYSQVKYLGYVVDHKGLHTDPDRVQAINDYPAPTKLKQVSRFLEELAENKVPLCHLLKKDVKWHW